MSQSLYPADSCSECELQAGARCPTCRHSLCIDHFPLDRHEPCATRLAAPSSGSICYVCGIQVVPRQWSASVWAHYVDGMRCAGCGRHICDTRHTKVRMEALQVARDGLHSSRYHVTQRYCHACAPFRRVGGGLVGAAWWASGAAAAVAAVIFLFVR
jgi:hypothetical protein